VQAKQNILLRLLLAIISSLFLVCSAAFAEEVVEVAVSKGDCLIKIAEEHLDDPAQWGEVARINHLKNADLIYPGQTIVIPVRLLRGIPGDGVVTWIQGDVTLKARDSQEWVPLHLHDRIREGSKIRTGDQSAVEIVFENGTSCLQKADTIAGFLKIRQKGDLYEQRLSIQRGRTVTKILKATGREPRFEIETPSTVCAARGTMFRTSVDSADAARFEVLEGKTEVAAMRKKVMVLEGEGTIVRMGEPPAEPKKLLPPPQLKKEDMPFRKLPIRLKFIPVERAVSYRIWITGDREGKDTVYENIVAPDEHPEVRGLDDGSYFLHALSIDEIGLEGIPAAPDEIRIRVNPLPPFINSPVTNQEYREKSMQCSWLSVQDAVAYHIQIARDDTFQHIIDETPAVSETVYRTRELDYGRYYFRIRSVAGDGYEGGWSDAISFAIVPPPPAPALDTPGVDKNAIHIRWQDLGQQVSYHFQLSRDPDFSAVLIERRLEKPEIVIEKPADPGRYYIRVSSIDSKGYEGSFSKPQSFVVKEGSVALFIGVAAALGLIFSLLP
jgi:hypothetical protein